MITVYVFGNEDNEVDKSAFEAARHFDGKIDGITFIYVKPNEDVPFAGEKKVIILDVIQGIDEVRLIEDKDLDRLVLPPRGTVHDFDLGFQLKYLKKLGKLGEVKIIGLPQHKRIDYSAIQAILKKLLSE